MNAPAGNTGLGAEEAARRLARDGPNVLPSALRRSWRSIALQAVREPMFALLFAAGLLYLVLGDLREGILMFALSRCTCRPPEWRCCRSSSGGPSCSIPSTSCSSSW